MFGNWLIRVMWADVCECERETCKEFKFFHGID